MGRRVRQSVARGFRVSAALPAEVGLRLVELEAATGETRSHLIRRAVEQLIQSASASPPPSTQLEAPERSAALVTHPRIQSLVEKIRAAGEDAGKLEEALVLTQALLFDTLGRIAEQADALERWQQLMDDDELPRTLTDPAALIPMIGEWRKLVSAIHKNRLVDAMTQAQVVGILERIGAEARRALEVELAAADLDERVAGEVTRRFHATLADRAAAIIAESR